MFRSQDLVPITPRVKKPSDLEIAGHHALADKLDRRADDLEDRGKDEEASELREAATYLRFQY